MSDVKTPVPFVRSQLPGHGIADRLNTPAIFLVHAVAYPVLLNMLIQESGRGTPYMPKYRQTRVNDLLLAICGAPTNERQQSFTKQADQGGSKGRGGQDGRGCDYSSAH